MYKILKINKSKQNIQTNNIINELSNISYDIIYVAEEVKTDKIEEIILSSNYMLLPDVLKKLTINNDIRNTYISLEIINKLIIDNIKIVETKNIYENICPNKNIKKRLKETVDKIVSRHYAANNIIRKYKYVLCNKKIKEKFFRKILVNIEKDIEKMESV